MTASRGRSVSSDCRVGSCRSRPIGASIRPAAGSRPAADEGEVRPLELAALDEPLSAARAPPPSGRRRAGPRCRGRAGGRSPVAPPPRPRRRARARRGRACRSRDRPTGARRRPPACRPRAGARLRRRRGDRRPAPPTATSGGRSSSISSPPASLALFVGRLPVDEHRPRRQEPLRRSPRAHLGEPGEKAVEPKPGGLVRDRDGESGWSGHAAAHGPPATGRRSARRRRPR